jgi:hypothetical protein
MARSLLAACLVSAGVYVLAGAGWALLGAGFLVFALWRPEPDWRALQARAGGAVRGLVARVKAAPRRATAVGGMAAGVLLLPAGAGLAAGAGVALIAAAVALAGVALMTGWGA